MTAKLVYSVIVSNYATLIRVVVILFIVSAIVIATGRYQPIDSIPPRSLVFLGLSGAATGLSWLCYFRALKIG